MQPKNQPRSAGRPAVPARKPAASPEPTPAAPTRQTNYDDTPAAAEERSVPMVALDPLADLPASPDAAPAPEQSAPAATPTPAPGAHTSTKASSSAQSAPGDDQIRSDGESVQWTAKEYIAPEKNTVWYILLALLVLLVIAADIWLLRSTFTVSILAVTIAAALVVMSVRPARTITYTMTDTGLYVDKQFLKFADYKAFGLVHDGKENSVMLIPLQSFLPGYSVYFPADKGEVIVDLLAQKLPNQPVKLDVMDRIANMLRL